MAIEIEYTLTLGTIIEVVSIMTGGAVAVGILRNTVKEIRTDIGKMEIQIADFAKSLIQLAVQSTRLDRMEEDIRDIRRGRGLVGVAMRQTTPEEGGN